MILFFRRLVAGSLDLLASLKKVPRPSLTSSRQATSTLKAETLEPRILYSAAPVEAVPAAAESDVEIEETAPAGEAQAVPAPTPVAATPVAVEAESIEAFAPAEAPQQDSAALNFPAAAEGGSSVSHQPAVSLVDVTSEAVPLNQQALEAVAEAARQRWIDSGLSDEQVAALDAIDYEISNIGSLHLGRANGFTITIDDDAGGSGGWFVDATPGQDEEFVPTGDLAFGAIPDSAAADRYDLLTAVMHEQGHVLGLRDLRGGTEGGSGSDLMAYSLGAGTRLVPESGQAQGTVPGSIDSDAYLSAPIVRASTSSAGVEGNSYSINPSISADGRYVLFESNADNLVANDNNGILDLFVKDLDTGMITRVNTSSTGVEANDQSFNAQISADGRFVVFESNATNLVANDVGGYSDIFVKNLATGTLTRVSTNSAGEAANNWSTTPSISADGRYVVFSSNADNLASLNWYAPGDVYRKDLVTGSTVLVSDFPYHAYPPFDGITIFSNPRPVPFSYDTSISADGSKVAFTASFYIPPEDPSDEGIETVTNIFVKNLSTGSLTKVSTSATGAEGNSDSWKPKISADGNFVVFESEATNLVLGDTNGILDIFLKNLTSGEVVRVNTDAAGNQTTSLGPGDFVFYETSISADGGTVAFSSMSDDLAPGGDSGPQQKVFVKYIATGEITQMVPSIYGHSSSHPSITADGSLVAFQSLGFDLVPDDNNNEDDIFVADPNGNPTIATYTTEISNDLSDNLVITDIDGGDTDDRLTIRTEGNQLVIIDPDNEIGFTAAGAVQISPHEVHVDLFTFTGNVIVRTLDGDDHIRVGDLSGLPAGIAIDTGIGEDQIRQLGQVQLIGAGALNYAAEQIELTPFGRINSLIWTEDGPIDLNASNGGVTLRDAQLLSSGHGSVTITGTGSIDAHNDGAGIFADDTSIEVLGDGNISLSGTGRGSGSANSGVRFINGVLDARGSGDINITGTASTDAGGKSNTGVTLMTDVFSATGDITIVGVGGTGQSYNFGFEGQGNISTQGSVAIQGVAHADTTKSSNKGIEFTGGIDAGADLTLDGTGGGGETWNQGVDLSRVDAEAGGALTILGMGRANTTKFKNSGIEIDRTFLEGASVMLTGTAGNGGGGNHGVLLRNSRVEAEAGSVQIDGTGGTGIHSNVGTLLSRSSINASGGGIMVSGMAQAATTGNNNRGIDASHTGFYGASVTLDGTGGGGKNNNEGVRVFGGDGITATAGAIDISGEAQTSTTGSRNAGVFLQIRGSKDLLIPVSATNGVNIDGTGGGGVSNNIGVYVKSHDLAAGTGAAVISGTAQSTTIGSNNAGIVLFHQGINGTAVQLTGVGGGGKSKNYGVVSTARAAISPFLPDLSTGTLTATVGTLTIHGTAQAGTTGSNNSGVYLKSPSLRAENGIDIDGIGGGGTSKNYGVYSRSLLFNAGNGNVEVDGQARAGTTGSDNSGVVIEYREITGASVSLVGIGGGGKSNNLGLRTKGDTIESTVGGITLNGTAQATTTGSKNSGVYLDRSDPRSATGIDITGIGGGGKNQNYGVYGFSMINDADNGDVTVTGTAQAATTGANNIGVLLKSSDLRGNAISIDGTGGGGTNNNMGVQLKGVVRRGSTDGLATPGIGSGRIEATGVGVTIRGTAQSTTTGSGNTGVWMQHSPITSANGIDIGGIGGGGRNNNQGTYLVIGSGASLLDAGSGEARITGAAANSTTGSGNNGVSLRGAGVKADGDITIAGDGGSGRNSNHGALLMGVALLGNSGSSAVTVSGVAHADTTGNSNRGTYATRSFSAEALSVSITGLGGGGKNNNDGLNLIGRIEATSGGIQINGEARAETTGTRNQGVQLGSVLRSAAGASVSITGQGGGGTDRNIGVHLRKSDVSWSLSGGNLDITGTARNSTLRNLNDGIFLDQTRIFGGTDTTISGTGGNGNNANAGIRLSRSEINSGTIALTGEANANSRGSNNHGIVGSTVDISGGALSVDGTGGGGSKLNHGIFLTKLTSQSGAVVNGVAGAGTGSLDQAGEPFP